MTYLKCKEKLLSMNYVSSKIIPQKWKRNEIFQLNKNWGFIASRFALEEMLQGVLQAENKKILE